MTSAAHALELTGGGLALAGRDGALLAEPACAVFDGALPSVGRAARGRARLVPLYASSRYLEEPALEPLPRPGPLARSHADLVYAHLRSLAPALGGEPLLLAVSSAYTLAELALLAGIAAAAGLAVAGIVDAAVAACADVASTPRALHLDLGMHRAVLTELDRGAELRRGRVAVARGLGLRAFEDAAARCVGRLLVGATRFDPLHRAASEQLLYDRLPAWLVAAAAGEATVAIEHAGLSHATRVRGAELAAALAPLAAEVTRLVDGACRAGEPVTLYTTAPVAAVPGLAAALAALEHCELVALPAGAAARGALARAAGLAGGAGLEFVSALRGAAALMPADPGGRAAPGAAPSHVLYEGRAYALGAEPLLVGREPGGAGGIVLSGPLAGVSRRHCRLSARGGEALLEDLSTYGTFLNGGRVRQRARLAAGDRIRVGTPGVELGLVRRAG
jgi:hypothetical protein